MQNMPRAIAHKEEYIMFVYQTRGTCSSKISIEIENNIVQRVVFTNGCPGNTAGVAKLAEGMEVDEVIRRLRGTLCRNGTSCPDQLARALEAWKAENAQ